jgi:hypothetical protein
MLFYQRKKKSKKAKDHTTETISTNQTTHIIAFSKCYFVSSLFFIVGLHKENHMETISKKPVRIVFLDISGVLATHRVEFSRLERGCFGDFDPVIVKFLESVCSKYLCYIVITSRKRKLFNDVEFFKSKMIKWGGGDLIDFLFPDDDLWRTTEESFNNKSLEINNWIKKFKEKYKHKFYIDNYAIIDDDSLGSELHDDHFVLVKNKQNGMGCEEYRKLIKILNNG